MSKQNLQIRNFFTPGDILAVLIIIAGLIVAMSFEEIAIRIIGVCISILGAVFLFILVSQRISDVVESRYPKKGIPTPDFKVTTTKDSSAKHQQVEDFGQSFGDDVDFPISVPSIIKTDTSDTDYKKVDNKTTEKSRNEHHESGYHDGFSGMRIVGKVKPVYKEQTATSPQPQTSKATSEPISRVTQSKAQEAAAEKATLFNDEKHESATNVAKAIPQTDSTEKIDKFLSDAIQSEFAKTASALNEVVTPKEQSPEAGSIAKYYGKVVDLPINVFIETDQILGDEPRKEFEYFMTRVLMIIRSSTDTRTALFMLFNSQTEELILESYVTSVPLAMKNKLRFKLGGDIVSRIISNAKPQILSEINPIAELDLIPYYNTSASTGSLIGVPVFWGDGIVGVLLADSESKNAYDSATVAFLGHFTKLVGALVKSYTHKYDLLQASKTLEAISTFHSIASQSRDGSENISEFISESLKVLFPNASNGTCGYDSAIDSWKVMSYIGSGRVSAEKAVSLEDTIVGQCIYECKTILVKSNDKLKKSRVVPEELSLNGEFLCVPIKSRTQIYGAIFLETDLHDTFTEFDISVVELLGDQAGNSIEKLYLMSSLQSSALYDQQTGLLNPTALYKRLQEELSRAKDFKLEMALCIFRFDKYASLDPENYPTRYEYITQLVLERIKRYIQDYDLYGSIDDNTYGIVFLGKDATKSRMTAERIRADVANSIINHDGKDFSVTISMGMASPSKDYDINVLIRDSHIGLERAYEAGNQVQVLY